MKLSPDRNPIMKQSVTKFQLPFWFVTTTENAIWTEEIDNLAKNVDSRNVS